MIAPIDSKSTPARSRTRLYRGRNRYYHGSLAGVASINLDLRSSSTRTEHRLFIFEMGRALSHLIWLVAGRKDHQRCRREMQKGLPQIWQVVSDLFSTTCHLIFETDHRDRLIPSLAWLPDLSDISHRILIMAPSPSAHRARTDGPQERGKMY
jgi:hypothetical protein